MFSFLLVACSAPRASVGTDEAPPRPAPQAPVVASEPTNEPQAVVVEAVPSAPAADTQPADAQPAEPSATPTTAEVASEPSPAAAEPAVAAPSGDELAWLPAPGVERKKTLEVRHYYEIANVHKAIDDGIGIDEPLSGQLDAWERLVWVDRVDAVTDGRVERFVRRHDDFASGGSASLAMPSPNGGRPRLMKQQDSCTSALAGREVRFTWIPAEGAYARLWERLDGPEDYLAGVDYDVDLVAALPTHAPAVDASWEIPVARAVAFLAPGGHRYFEPKAQDPFSRSHRVGAGGEVAALLRAPEGKITATYRGKRSVGGRECGVIEVRLEVRSTTDRKEAFESIKPPAEANEPRRLTVCTVDAEFTGTGEILWDLEAKRFHRYTLSGAEKITTRLSKQALGVDEKTSTFHEDTRLEGTFKVELANDEAPPKKD